MTSLEEQGMHNPYYERHIDPLAFLEEIDLEDIEDLSEDELEELRQFAQMNLEASLSIDEDVEEVVTRCCLGCFDIFEVEADDYELNPADLCPSCEEDTEEGYSDGYYS